MKSSERKTIPEKKNAGRRATIYPGEIPTDARIDQMRDNENKAEELRAILRSTILDHTGLESSDKVEILIAAICREYY